jgi:diguanylate cyclase (GGDEF)-like protein
MEEFFVNDLSERKEKRRLSVFLFPCLLSACLVILIFMAAWGYWLLQREDIVDVALQRPIIGEGPEKSASVDEVLEYARRLSETEQNMRDRNTRFLLLLSLVFAGLLISHMILEKRGVWNPLSRCVEFAQNIVSGKYDAHAVPMKLREFDALVSSLNRMKDNLFTDPMTGASSRAALAHHFDFALREFARYNIPFTMLLFDVDYFKKVNDTYGHLVGDLCLKHIIEVIKCVTRRSDNVYRIGGEEFVCLLPKTELSGALIAAEKIRSSVEQTPLEHEGMKIFVTMSIGVTPVELDETLDAVIARADSRMYTAKRSGRNRIVHTDAEQTETASI